MQAPIFEYKSLVPDAPRGIYITLQGEDRKARDLNFLGYNTSDRTAIRLFDKAIAVELLSR